MTREFKGPDRARIVADWAAAFPNLGVHAAAAGSPRLVRRAGPIVAGICLERRTDTTSYRPTAFVHFLGTPQPSLSLTGATVPARPNGAPMIVRVGVHDREFSDAAARLRASFPLDLDQHWGVDDVVGACLALANREAAELGPRMAGALLEIVSLTPVIAAGDPGARYGLDLAARAIDGWADYDTREVRSWLSEFESRAQDPAQLRRVVMEEARRHRLQRVPNQELTQA